MVGIFPMAEIENFPKNISITIFELFYEICPPLGYKLHDFDNV